MTERVIRVTIDPATKSGALKVEGDLKRIQTVAALTQRALNGINGEMKGLATGGSLNQVAKDALGLNKGLTDSIKNAQTLSKTLSGIKVPKMPTMPTGTGGGSGAGGMGAGLKGLIGGAALTTLARDVTGYAQALAGLSDEYSKIQNQLRLVTTGSENLATVQGELFKLAQETRSPLEATSVLYAKIARNAAQLGLSQKEILGVTKTVNQAIQVSGGTASEASAGVIQFSQALASGVLRGDELRSMMENMPRLSQALSEGLGVNIGDLRKMGEAGELTAEKVIGALQKSAAGVNAEFDKLTPTIGAAFTVLRNQIVDTIGKMNEASGAGAAFAKFVIESAKFVSQFGAALVGTLQPTQELSAGMKIFTTILISLYTILKSIVTIISGVVTTAFKTAGELIGGVAASLDLLIHGEFRKAGSTILQTFRDIDTNIANGFKDTAATLVGDMSQSIEKLVEIWNQGARDAAPAQVALAGADMTKKGKGEQTFDQLAEEIKRNSVVWQQTPTALPESQSDFEPSTIFKETNDQVLKEIEEANQASWDRIRYNMGQIKEETSDYAKAAAENIQGAFADFLFDPFKDGLDGMLKGFAETMRRIAAEALAAKAMEALGGFLSKSGNPWLSAIGGVMGGRAEGGSVSKGVPYMVNERAYQKKRPEVFVPNRSGRVMDQSKAGGAPAANSSPVVIVRDESELANAISSHKGTQDAFVQYVTNHPGKFRRALGINS